MIGETVYADYYDSDINKVCVGGSHVYYYKDLCQQFA